MRRIPKTCNHVRGGTSCDLNAPRCTTTVLAGTFTRLSMTVFIGCTVKDRPAAPCFYIRYMI